MKIEMPNKIKYIIELFYTAGFEAFAVGGCVRDTMLGKYPHDWDLTTNAKPSEIKKLLQAYKTIDTGIQYGTVTLLYEDETIEITTYRLDLGYDDNRRPRAVNFSDSLTDDLSRRDFTINAMAYNDRCGLVDAFGGTADLQNRLIRTVGDSRTRFCEDGLRILRGLRFAAVLGFTIEPHTASEIHKCKNLLQNIAGERLNAEFTDILLSDNCSEILETYADVIGVFIPELLPLIGLEQRNPYHAYNVFHHTLKSLEHTPAEKTIRYAVFFHDFGKATTKTTGADGIDHFRNHPAVSERKAEVITERLKFSNEETAAICRLVKYHDTPIICDEYHIKRWLNRFGEDFFRNLMLMKIADIHGQNPDMINRLEEAPKYYELLDKILAEEQCFKISDLAVNGDDLIKIGYKPGPKLGKTLNHLLDEVMQGQLSNDKILLLETAELLK